jgi:hypothetical protein
LAPGCTTKYISFVRHKPACRLPAGKGRAKAEAQSFDFNMTFLSGLGLFWLFFNF